MRSTCTGSPGAAARSPDAGAGHAEREDMANARTPMGEAMACLAWQRARSAALAPQRVADAARAAARPPAASCGTRRSSRALHSGPRRCAGDGSSAPGRARRRHLVELALASLATATGWSVSSTRGLRQHAEGAGLIRMGRVSLHVRQAKGCATPPGRRRAGAVPRIAGACPASSRFAAASLRCAPSGDPAQAPASWLATAESRAFGLRRKQPTLRRISRSHVP